MSESIQQVSFGPAVTNPCQSTTTTATLLEVYSSATCSYLQVMINGMDLQEPIARPLGNLKQSKAKAKQRCVMGIGRCLYAQLVQTKNKQCKSAIILQCYHPHLSDFCSNPG